MGGAEILLWTNPNLKLFAGRDRNEFFLYREKVLLWRKKLPDPRATVLGVANNGLVLMRAEEGIFPYYVSGEDPLLPVERYRTAALAQNGARIEKVLVEETGHGFIAEKVTEKSKLTESVFSLLGKAKAGGGNLLYELMRYDMASESEDQVWRFVAEKERGDFTWEMTPDLTFLAIAEERPRSFPQKGLVTQLLLCVPREGKSLYSATLPEAHLNQMRLGYSGTLLLTLEGQEEIVGIRPDGKKFFLTLQTGTDPGQVEILHVGKEFAVLEDRAGEKIYFKSFEDRRLLTIDLNVLGDLNTRFHFFFRPNDDLVLASLDEPGHPLKLVYTTLEHLEIECKRWQLQAEEIRNVQEIQRKAREEDERRLREQQEISARKRQALASASLGEPDPLPSAARRVEILKQLERLKLQRVTGAIPEEEAEKQQKLLETELQSLSADQHPLALEGTAKSHQATADEKKHVEELLEKLEERFIRGEVSEKTYLELKEKYQRKLRA